MKQFFSFLHSFCFRFFFLSSELYLFLLVSILKCVLMFPPPFVSSFSRDFSSALDLRGIITRSLLVQTENDRVDLLMESFSSFSSLWYN